MTRYTLALDAEDCANGGALFIKKPTVAVTWFLNVVDYYKRRSVRITRENFDQYFPIEPEQLELPFYRE